MSVTQRSKRLSHCAKVAGLLIVAWAAIFAAIPARAEVYVEPVNTVVSQALAIRGWAYQALPLTISAGATMHLEVGVSGGLDNAIQIWIVDLANLQFFQAGRQFNYFVASSSRVAQHGSVSFTAPATNNYYVIFDNRAAFFTRSLFVRVDQIGGPPNAWSNALTALYSARYATLKNFVNFDDFNITVRSCGVINAFSDPNVTICTELLDDLQRKGVPGSEEFTFYHEVGHSLLKLWGDPDYDNEDTADSFSTAMMMLMGRQDLAFQAAQWFADNNSIAEATATQTQDNPHSLSIQRARNIIKWLGQRDDRVTRWLRLMIPHMTDAALVETINRNVYRSAVTDDDKALDEAMRKEISERRRSAAN